MKYLVRGNKMLGEDIVFVKDRKCWEIEELKVELRKVKNVRVEIEKEREFKVC